MFPWWVSWHLRWWASTVCSLTILLALQPSSSSILEKNEGSRAVRMFADGDKVYKWDPARSNAYVLQSKFQSPNQSDFVQQLETGDKFNTMEFDDPENFLYWKNKLNNKYQRVHDTRFSHKNESSNNFLLAGWEPQQVPMMSDQPGSNQYGGETFPNPDQTYSYPVGYSPSKHIIFPFKIPRDINSLEVPSGSREKQDTGGSSRYRARRPPPQVVSHVIKPPSSNGKKSKSGMGGSALLNPLIRPKQIFATEPAPQTAVIGSTAVLPCRVMGKVGHLQWTKDGFGMGTDRDLYGFYRYAMIGDDDEGDYSLRIQPVMLEDDALFQCQVSAIDGIPGIRSRPVRLTVYVPPDPPVIRPKILETTAGTQSVLQCESIGGRPSPEIQWVDDSRRESIQMGSSVTSNLMDDGKRSVVRSRLTFTPRRYHNNNTITCLTSNQALSSPLTSSVILRVMFLPEVQLTSRPGLLIEGDDATFLCNAQANPPTVTYRWFVNDHLLKNKTSRALGLESISRSLHRNRISCEVSNKVGSIKETINIIVHYGPTFRSMPRDVMAEVGVEATLKCNVDANPSPSIVWLRKGSTKIIGSGSSLIIRVQKSSAGVYKCIAGVRGRDFDFPELVGHLKLLLKGPPQIVSESEQLGRLGDTVSIVCSTVSVPSPIKVTWTYNGREIDLNDPHYEMVADEGKERIRNILVIHDSDSSDFGAYNCSVVNEYGRARKLIMLQKEKRIPILLVVLCVLAVVIIAVVVASLVFCNKRHAVKGTSTAVPEKDFSEDNEATKSTNNMYNLAPTDDVNAKVSNETVPSHHSSTDPERLQVSGSGRELNQGYTPVRRKSYQNDTKITGSSIHQSLSGEINHEFIQPREHQVKTSYEDYHYKSQSQHNIYYPLDELGRRALTHSSLIPPSHHKYASSAETEYCTIRRGSSPYHHRNNGTTLLGGSSKTPLLSNGSLNYCSPKRSPYNSSTTSGGGAWTTQPPPYQRVLPSLCNGRVVGRNSSNPPITTRSTETKVKFSPGSKLVSGATYI